MRKNKANKIRSGGSDLNKDTKVKCGWCDKISTVEEWNDYTFSQCISREMRRAFTPLFKRKAFRRDSNTFYRCPKCDTWSRGSQLFIVDFDNSELSELGGEPIIRIVKDTNEE